MDNNKTVSKSIRLPLSMVEYIELQPYGDNFSQQLLGILNDYRDGDAERKKKLLEYRSSIERYKDAYNRLVRDYTEAYEIMNDMQWYLRRLKTLVEDPLPQSLEASAEPPPAIRSDR